MLLKFCLESKIHPSQMSCRRQSFLYEMDGNGLVKAGLLWCVIVFLFLKSLTLLDTLVWSISWSRSAATGSLPECDWTRRCTGIPRRDVLRIHLP